MDQPTDDRWDLSSWFAGVDDPAFARCVATLSAGIDRLEERAGADGPLSIEDWERFLLDLEGLETIRDHLVSCMQCARAVDPSNGAVAAQQSRIFGIAMRLRGSITHLLLRLREMKESEFEALCARPILSDACHRLFELKRRARHVLPPAEERLLGQLEGDALHRWSRLALDTLASTRLRMTWPDGRSEMLPTSYRYELFWDERAEVRRLAFDALNAAFEPHARLLAECLNAMIGSQGVVATQRGTNIIEEVMMDNGVERSTIDTLQAALHAKSTVMRSYMGIKRRLLGLESLGIYDRSAPLAAHDLKVGSVAGAKAQILAAFERFSPDIAAQSKQIFDRRWIESEMRPGKMPGGFCATSPLKNETRIFMSLGGSFNSVAVLAHELGHAFHSQANFALRLWRQPAPAPLAETASILCEHFVRRAIYKDPTRPRSTRIAALAAHLDAAVNYLLRIPRDYDFEMQILAERSVGDLSAERLCAVMSTAHRSWFGDATTNDGSDQWSWAYNHLFMDPRLRLYSFPYSFGFLLSYRLADLFEAKPFTKDYIRFLHASASMPVAEAVMTTLGFDVTEGEFWSQALSRIDADVEMLRDLSGTL